MCLYFFLGIGHQPVFAQESKKLKIEASESFAMQQYGAALNLYLEILKEEPANTEANFYAALCYLKTLYRQKALPYIQKAYQTNPTFDPKIEFVMGEAYQCDNQFDKAIGYYTLYKRNQENKDEQEMLLVNKRLEECNNGLQYIQHPVRVLIKNIGSVINGKFPDYAPVISSNEAVMFFTSRREGSTGHYLAPEDGLFYEDIYLTYHKDGKWSHPLNIGASLNTDTHDACIAASPNGKQLFIYQDSRDGDIYTSLLLDSAANQWSKPEGLGNNVNSKYHETSVSITADGNIVYFSSDRPGGIGGLDIYKSYKNHDGSWGTAINLGPIINTPYDDDAPFIHPDGKTLYFSSRGHSTMGGFDIFRSFLENDLWTSPQNLGFPINTSAEDIYFVLSADNNHGYYASANGEGFGEKDIYIISLPEYEEYILAEQRKTFLEVPLCVAFVLNPAILTKTTTLLRGIIRDATTRVPLKANITLSDKESNKVILECTSSPVTGNYSITLPSGRNYDLTIHKPGYRQQSNNQNLLNNLTYKEVNLDVNLQRITEAEQMDSSQVLTPYIPAATDSLAQTTTTGELENLIARGPSVNTNFPDLEINDGIDFYPIKPRKKKPEEAANDSTATNGESQPSKPDRKKIVLHSIRFNLGSATLTKDSDAGLGELFQMLANSPDMKMEIAGHADKTGGVQLNQILSEKRAKAVVDYLIKKSISSNRLTYKGYGASRPIASNATEEGRKLNRRTEFEVVED
ncbi:MAG: OmpA family protein [Bacteroidota bacterium]